MVVSSPEGPKTEPALAGGIRLVPKGHPFESLGDFTTNRRLIPVSLVAIAIGVVSAFVALGLLDLIGFFTNVFYFQRASTAFVSPAKHALGALSVLVPVAGALVIGLMARYGSERIRGHGIPEALEAILIRGSRIEPRVALLKPLSAAISIGSGGPFGAEGPIIMTGGAFGSIFAQLLSLTNAERKTLLVAGAAAGMSATFASPLAAVLLAVELLLFEWKPRSFIPVALASAAAMATRHYLMGPGPLFPVAPHPAFVGPSGLFLCAVSGLLAGGLSAALTASVYGCENLFLRLKLHWMWWPAIGGLGIGIGGLIEPRALGVGYDTIESLLRGSLAAREVLLLVAVKWAIWAFSLGSGTSGGVLAPLLMMGGALGGIEALVFPDEGIGFWPLVSMGAILGGTMRSPFTGVVFAFELTRDPSMLLPLLVAAVSADAVTVLALRRSILTEKVARRGYHVSREYAIDPLEILFAREVMRTAVVVLPSGATPAAAAPPVEADRGEQRLFPVGRADGTVLGVVTLRDLRRWAREGEGRPLEELATRTPVTAHPDEPLRVVVERMAETGKTCLPVVADEDATKVVGMINLKDLLKARVRHREEEGRRERVLVLPFARPLS